VTGAVGGQVLANATVGAGVIMLATNLENSSGLGKLRRTVEYWR
jgi:hypothetical protein